MSPLLIKKGKLLTRGDSDEGVAMSNTQMDYSQKLEQRYIRRIEDILSPIVGLDGVRAQVVAEVDFTITEQTQERYNPDLAAVRSEQVQEDSRCGCQWCIWCAGCII